MHCLSFTIFISIFILIVFVSYFKVLNLSLIGKGKSAVVVIANVWKAQLKTKIPKHAVVALKAWIHHMILASERAAVPVLVCSMFAISVIAM